MKIKYSVPIEIENPGEMVYVAIWEACFEFLVQCPSSEQ
jgi:hypothetical protein